MNLTNSQAEKLIKGCIKNDRGAQETLYRLFYAEMLRVATAIYPIKSWLKRLLTAAF